MFDFRTYDAVKALLQAKDRRFVESMADHIASRFQKSVSILDVGVFDCRNTVALKLALEARNVAPVIVAIEPDPTPKTKSTARAHNIRFGAISYQELLVQPYAVGPRRYDCILMQNLFYHIHRSEWHALLTQTSAIMSPESGCVVSLVSRECSLYTFIADFLEKYNVPETERTFLKHGQYVFFEDFFDGDMYTGLVLRKSLEIASGIRLADATGSELRALSAAQKSAVKAAALTRLSFFGRISLHYLKRMDDDAFASILRAQPAEGFQTVDRIAMLTRASLTL